ncbi:MAG: biotin--[acetyl-CoA-carboxylase] ligase [Pseudomonadota bacterium]|nr:biotin--[acetyl-CoA-carboxylase] ligase [Sphingomonas sp.]MDQ3482916.1 biotin--[acetyl-CoA-carboxylase] ligase [Pseudomonadota bacterium]
MHIVECTGSTNADLLAQESAVEGDWLVAMEQTAGRGRQGRGWITRPGNFFGSAMVNIAAGDPPPQSLSLAAGLALIEAVDIAAPELPLLLKWPNDLLLDGAKLAGILLERQNDRVVVGFGVNLAGAPDLPDRPAAHLGGRISPHAFAPLLAASMGRLLELWRTSEPAAFARAWLARAHAPGTELNVHSADAQALSGYFDGIDPDGTLRLRLADGTVRAIHAADVTLG